MSRFTSRSARGFIAIGAATAALTLAAPLAAQADPPSGPAADPAVVGSRTYQIAGSDTIQDVFNGIAYGYSLNPASQTNLDSWNAFGPIGPTVQCKVTFNQQITTRSGGTPIYRPAGSGDGAKALSASWNSNHSYSVTRVPDASYGTSLAPCITTPTSTTSPITVDAGTLDFSRSSSKPSATVPGGTANDRLTYVPFARDAVAPVLQKGSGSTYNVITNLTTDQLNAIFGDGQSGETDGSGNPTPVISYNASLATVVYNTNPGNPADTSDDIPLYPVLPQSSSGTRQFFLSVLGNPAIGAWVTQGIAENTANQIDAVGQIAPFSVAQWIAQKNGVAATTFTGTNSAYLTLLQADGVVPTLGTAPSLSPNPAYYGPANLDPADAAFGSHPYARDTYVVVPTANYTGAVATLVNGLGQKSYGFPTLKYVVQDFGFLRLNYTTSTQGQYHSDWTN